MESFTERFKRSSKDSSKQSKSNKVVIGPPLEKHDPKLQTNDLLDHTNNGPSMLMKCVIVTKDAKGYGLTVSGDNPVYVQSVKEDGAAAKAGVVQGDRILKVNGEKVTDRNHMEVVKLIKSGNYVALTLLGPPPTTYSESSDVGSTSSLSNPSEQATAKQHQSPKANFYDEKILTLKLMLDQEKATVEKIKTEYSKNPDPKLLKDLFQAEKVQEDLHKQLWKMDNMRNNIKQNYMTPSTSTNPFEVDDSPPKYESIASEDPLLVMDDPSEAADSLKKFTATDASKQSKYNKELLNTNHSDILPEHNSSVMVVEDTMDLFKDYSPTNPFANTPLMNSENGKLCSQQNNQIMNFEDDDDIVAQCDVDHGPFNELDSLRQKPAHLAVFFNYVIGSKESAEFLFTLAVDNLKQLSSSKDMLKLADSINKAYISSNAPFKIDADPGTSQTIQSLLSSKNPTEEALRKVFDSLVQKANGKIRNQLAVYRMKREQGLGSLFGDEKLQHAGNVDQQQTEIRIVDEIIMPTLTEWMQKKGDDVEQARIVLIQEALQAFLNQYGTKRAKKTTSRIYSMLKSKPTAPSMKSAKIVVGQDTTSEDQNNRKSIGAIFTVKSRRRHDVNTDKSKHKSNRPFSHIEPMKPVKVGVAAEIPPSSHLGLPDGDDRNSAHLKRADKSFESLQYPSAKDGLLSRSKPEDWQSRGRAHTATIMPSPSIKQPVFIESNILLNDDPGVNSLDTVDGVGIEKNHRRRRDDENRLSLGSSKSNSDPDKNKINQALGLHSANEQGEQTSRHHTLSTTESTLSLNIDDRKALDNLPIFTDDPEIEIDETVQQWTDLVPDSVTKHLEKKEIRRQQIINELMLTEKHHVRDLKILEKLFYDRLLSEDILVAEERQVLFPNLIEILSLHRDLNQALMAVKERDGHVVKEIGDILLSRFDGEGGNTFKTECATYCGNQSSLLSTIKEKAKKDQSFKLFLQTAQKHPVCRRFHLKDFIPLEFQRLTKYPLLLENIVKYTKERKKGKHNAGADIEKVKKACEQCREILAYVNQTVKEAEDKQKIIEIQRNLDREPILKLRNPSPVIREFLNMDLTSKPALYQGTLTWRVALTEKRKEIPLQCILYDDVFVLLQKQEDRYVLKCQGSQSDKSSGGLHAPFIKIDSTLIVRNVATDKRAFFAMPTTDSGPQMYQFAASGANEMKQWMNLLNETARKRIGKATPPLRRAALSVSSCNEPAGNLVLRAEGGSVPEFANLENVDEYASDGTPVSPGNSPDVAAILNQLSQKDQEIKKAISIKFKLLAEMLGLDESEVESILEISSLDPNPDPNMLISHSILCVDKLTGLLNESAIAKSSFAKSRNQSHADVQSLNQLSLEEAETGSQSDPGEKWADAVSHPSAIAEPPSDEVDAAKTGNDVEEVAEESNSSNADDLSIENLEVSGVDDGFKDALEGQRSLSESSESTLENECVSSGEIAENSEQASEIEQSSIAEKSLDQQSDNVDEISENIGEISENVTESQENIAESSEDLGNDSQTETPVQIESTSLDSANENTEPNMQTEAPLNTEPNGTEVDASHSTAVSDDASDHTKSRPLSEVEICSRNNDVPLSKLMEIALLLQTQLTQLMQSTEEKESKMKELRQENKKLKEELEAHKKSQNRSMLPSYDEAMNEGNRHSTSPGSLVQGSTIIHTSLSRHSDNVSATSRVPGRSTGF